MKTNSNGKNIKSAHIKLFSAFTARIRARSVDGRRNWSPLFSSNLPWLLLALILCWHEFRRFVLFAPLEMCSLCFPKNKHTITIKNRLGANRVASFHRSPQPKENMKLQSCVSHPSRFVRSACHPIYIHNYVDGKFRCSPLARSHKRDQKSKNEASEGSGSRQTIKGIDWANKENDDFLFDVKSTTQLFRIDEFCLRQFIGERCTYTSASYECSPSNKWSLQCLLSGSLIHIVYVEKTRIRYNFFVAQKRVSILGNSSGSISLEAAHCIEEKWREHFCRNRNGTKELLGWFRYVHYFVFWEQINPPMNERCVCMCVCVSLAVAIGSAYIRKLNKSLEIS